MLNLEFQTFLPPPPTHAFGIPSSFKPPLGISAFFFQLIWKALSVFQAPLWIIYKRKLILSLPLKEKNGHSARQTINVILYIVTFHRKTYTTDNELNII